MFIKLTNGDPETYSIEQLHQDNPNVSFPREIPTKILAEYNVYPLTVADIPSYNELTEKAVLDTPIEVDGVWIQNYSVVQLPEQEASALCRSVRNDKLSSSDWTQVADAPVDQTAWATYRQALRDITSQEGFPFNIIWPTKPE